VALTSSVGSAVIRVRAVRARIGEGRLKLAGQVGLAAWFAVRSLIRLHDLISWKIPVGMDIQIYYRGVQAWLNGHDPWAAAVILNDSRPFSYAGSPATTVLLAPSALLSETQFTVLWLAVTALSALAIIRWLKLPLWWLLFPPTFEAMYSGNPQLVVLMLLLAGARPMAGRLGWLADSVATALKVYAIIPLLGERKFKRLALAAVVTVATFAIAPSLWIHYAEEFGAISSRLARESDYGYSAFYSKRLIIPTAIAIFFLWLKDRRAAWWLAVPALWPASEFHYSTFAQPVMTPFLAVTLAVPIQQLPPIAIIVYVIWRYASAPIHSRLSAWAGDPTPAAQTG
jgi:hypothetical protein